VYPRPSQIYLVLMKNTSISIDNFAKVVLKFHELLVCESFYGYGMYTR